jgi:hypothetical protein
MTTDPTTNDGEAAADVSPTTPRPTSGFRSAITARPEARLDGNSSVGRRVRDLHRALMARLGDPTDVIVVADVLAWAELKAAAEVARARLLEGDNQSSNEVVRLENLTRRAAASVGLEPSGQADEPAHPYAALLLDEEELNGEQS